MNSENFRRKLIDVNSRFDMKHLHKFGREIGLCAEFNNITETLVKCIASEIQFCLEEVKEPKGIAVQKGWQDYFLPFCTEIPNTMTVLNRKSFYARKYRAIRPVFRTILQHTTGCSSFLFDSIGHGWPAKINVKALSHQRDFDSISGEVALALWKFNDKVSKDIGGSAFGDERYDFAIHLRRGDKIQEFSYVSLDAYVEALEPWRDSGKSVFVASDDFSEKNRLCDLLVKDFSLSVTPTILDKKENINAGYDQKTFNDLPANIRQNKIVELLCEIEIMRQSGTFIGASTSNVFITLKRLRKNVDVIDLSEGAWSDRKNWRRF